MLFPLHQLLSVVKSTSTMHKQHGRQYLMLWYYQRYYNECTLLRIPMGSIQRIGSLDRLFLCHVVYPPGKPEDFRSCVVKGLR